MAFKRRVKLPPVTGIDAAAVVGQIAHSEIPIGPRYHHLEYTFSNTAGDYAEIIVDEVRVLVNGVMERQVKMNELIALNVLHGSQYDSLAAGTAAHGALGYAEISPILFAEYFRKEVFYQEFKSWGTGGLSSLAVDFVLKGVAGIAISGRAAIDQSLVTVGKSTIQQPLGQITKWYRRQTPINGTEATFTNFPMDKGAYEQISFFDADISSVMIRLRDVIVYELTKQESDAILIRNDMTPVAGRFDIVFDYEDILDSTLPTTVFNGVPLDMNDLRFDLVLSDGTPRNIPTILQIFGNPD